jgi:hypothetical protein
MHALPDSNETEKLLSYCGLRIPHYHWSPYHVFQNPNNMKIVFEDDIKRAFLLFTENKLSMYAFTKRMHCLEVVSTEAT